MHKNGKSDKQQENFTPGQIIGTTLGSTAGGIISIILYVVGLVIAAMLSWRCNSRHGFGALSKLLFAFIAGLMSWSYLLAYAIYKWGTC